MRVETIWQRESKRAKFDPMNPPKKPKPTKAKQTDREKEIDEILEDADLKKFDPELLKVAPPMAKKKPRATR